MKNYIGDRLREERERLGLSQTAMGEIGGVKKLTQLNYEKGDRVPDGIYLNAVAKVGVDVQFVVTGIRSTTMLSKDEEELINLFKKAPLVVKAAVLGALTAGSSTSNSVQVSGQGNRIAGRDFNENKK